MTKDKFKPTSQEREKTTAVISRELAEQVRTIADHRDETMLETLNRVAGPVVLKEYRKVLDEKIQAVALSKAGAAS